MRNMRVRIGEDASRVARLAQFGRPVRVNQSEFSFETPPELRLVWEEELELEQVTQPQRLVPSIVFDADATIGGGGQHKLDDRAVHQHVHDAVAVEGGVKVVVRRDSPDWFQTAIETDHHPVVGKPVQRMAQLASQSKVTGDG